MSDTPRDIVPEILMKIQDDIAFFRRDATDRLNRLETIQKQERRNTAAMLVMMRGTAGLYEERLNQLEIDRIVKIEERLAALEAARN